MPKHRLPLTAILVGLLATAAACGSGSGSASGGASAAAPDPAEASGSSGAYVAPADPSAALCKQLDYGPLKDLFSTPSGDPKLENLGNGRSSSGARCSQQLSDTGASQSGGAYVSTHITYWHDVDLARTQFAYTRQQDAKNNGTDGKSEPVSGVGTEAFRLVYKDSKGPFATLEFDARYSNLEVNLLVVATSDTDYTQEQFDKVFKALGDYTRQVFTTVRKVGPS
jgi:hypothetical protein